MDDEGFLVRFSERPTVTFAVPDARDVARVDGAARAVAILVWQRRYANEQASVTLAERLVARADDLDQALPAKAFARLAADERAHVAIAASVLEALGGERCPAAELRDAPRGEVPAASFARDVVVGLALCESISAARFRAVLRATDLSSFRRVVRGLLRDELAHAALGFALLARTKRLLAATLGVDAADAFLRSVALDACLELERHVGLDGARKGLPPERPQPAQNPGVVEPAVDARAFYAVLERRVLPRLAAQGVLTTEAFARRFDA